jgi:hypothetical protein
VEVRVFPSQYPRHVFKAIGARGPSFALDFFQVVQHLHLSQAQALIGALDRAEAEEREALLAALGPFQNLFDGDPGVLEVLAGFREGHRQMSWIRSTETIELILERSATQWLKEVEFRPPVEGLLSLAQESPAVFADLLASASTGPRQNVINRFILAVEFVTLVDLGRDLTGLGGFQPLDPRRDLSSNLPPFVAAVKEWGTPRRRAFFEALLDFSGAFRLGLTLQNLAPAMIRSFLTEFSDSTPLTDDGVRSVVSVLARLTDAELVTVVRAAEWEPEEDPTAEGRAEPRRPFQTFLGVVAAFPADQRLDLLRVLTGLAPAGKLIARLGALSTTHAHQRGVTLATTVRRAMDDLHDTMVLTRDPRLLRTLTMLRREFAKECAYRLDRPEWEPRVTALSWALVDLLGRVRRTGMVSVEDLEAWDAITQAPPVTMDEIAPPKVSEADTGWDTYGARSGRRLSLVLLEDGVDPQRDDLRVNAAAYTEKHGGPGARLYAVFVEAESGSASGADDGGDPLEGTGLPIAVARSTDLADLKTELSRLGPGDDLAIHLHGDDEGEHVLIGGVEVGAERLGQTLVELGAQKGGGYRLNLIICSAVGEESPKNPQELVRARGRILARELSAFMNVDVVGRVGIVFVHSGEGSRAHGRKTTLRKGGYPRYRDYGSTVIFYNQGKNAVYRFTTPRHHEKRRPHEPPGGRSKPPSL